MTPASSFSVGGGFSTLSFIYHFSILLFACHSFVWPSTTSDPHCSRHSLQAAFPQPCWDQGLLTCQLYSLRCSFISNTPQVPLGPPFPWLLLLVLLLKHCDNFSHFVADVSFSRQLPTHLSNETRPLATFAVTLSTLESSGRPSCSKTSSPSASAIPFLSPVDATVFLCQFP